MIAFQVGLHRGDDRAVDDPDHREHEQDRREVDRRLREQLEREPQEAVGRPSSGSRRPARPSPRSAPRCARRAATCGTGTAATLIANAAMNAEEQQHFGGAGDERRSTPTRRASRKSNVSVPVSAWCRNASTSDRRRAGTPSPPPCRGRTSSPRTRRLPCPQPRMRKYIGTSMSSQNTKNTIEVEREEDPHDRALEQEEPRT